jgi:hypothetical protein
MPTVPRSSDEGALGDNPFDDNILSVQRDIRRLTDTVATVGALVDEHTDRLERIEERLGLAHAPNSAADVN